MCVYASNRVRVTVKGASWERLSVDSQTGQITVFCQSCNLWENLYYFDLNPRTQRIGKVCSKCKGSPVRKTWMAESKNAQEKRYRLRFRAEQLEADKLFNEWISFCEKGGMALIGIEQHYDVIIGWIDDLKRMHDTLDLIAIHTGLQVRRLTAIIARTQEKISVDKVERICEAAGGSFELILPSGRDGWGSHGERHCLDCGSWFHPHHCMGRCRRCYNNYLRRGRTEIPLKDYWSKKHRLFGCRLCHLNKLDGRYHRGRGLCGLCLAHEHRVERLNDELRSNQREAEASSIPAS